MIAVAEMRSSLESMLPVNGYHVVTFKVVSRERWDVVATAPDSLSYTHEFATDNYCTISESSHSPST
jgi:hypothetical protein